MKLTIHDRERLKRILDLSDRLGRLRRRMRDSEHLPTTTELKEEVRSIAGSVVSIGLPGVLGRLADERHLSPQEVMVLLLLLNRRIEGGSPLNGREVLTLLFPSAFGVLTSASMLTPESPLRACGAIAAAEPESDDPLETRYRLGDDLFRAIQRDASTRADGERQVPPYRSHFEHLAEVGRLTSLLFRRANAIFEVDPFGHHAFEESETPETLDRRAAVLAERITARLAATENSAGFPFVELVRRLKLTADEQLVVVALLVQDCLYGNPGIEAVDLVRMISRDEAEVLRKRGLLDAGGRLRREGILEAGPSEGDVDLPEDLTLSDAVVAKLLGDRGREGEGAIGADFRLEFHEYLKGLDDSGRFYRDLGG